MKPASGCNLKGLQHKIGNAVKLQDLVYSILIYKVEMVFRLFLFVCLFVPYTNPHFWTNLNQTLHTSPQWPGGGRRVCMDPQYWTPFDLFNLFCQKPVQNPGHKLAAGPRVIATALYPWCSRRHLRQESSATAYIRDVADDTFAFVLEVSCTVDNAETTRRSERNACV
jgi:hypothetical protein